MSYEEQYKETKKSKALVNLTPEFVTFEKKGDYVLGRLISKNEVSSQLGTTTYTQYLFETDKGLIKFALGRATDNEINTLFTIGGVYRVEFLGKEDLAGGRKINRFNIEGVQMVEPGVTDDDDIPF